MNYYYELDTRTKKFNEQQWQWWCQPNCSPAEGGYMDFKLHDDMLANSTRVWLENANSIYLIKPAPFCILDEVDAPLDDANVGKFTNMIRRFSENSQFIIVTHNKMTMSAVDVIYGVTMQEPGVSKLVPVDFRSLN